LEGKNEKVGVFLTFSSFWATRNENKILTGQFGSNREVERLSAEVHDYESFLDDLRNSAESRTADWVKTLLEKVCLLAPALC
jgi:predicted enzyme involved in methoxymalonyl-ACP biosynthesis